jgi:hypothetical protein
MLQAWQSYSKESKTTFQNLNSNLMVGWAILERLISNTSTTNHPPWIRN